ncbi:MAG: serine protease [Gammaproteobacteria bacterium]|nr:serine protease [Gammaproteobacteria bacterium]
MKPFLLCTVIIAFAAASLFATSASADTPTVSPRIIGGSSALKGDYPWAAALLRPGFIASVPGTLFCGGSLIQPRWVLTAAHCVDTLAANNIDVAVGIEDLRDISVSERIAVSGVYVHPAYNNANKDNDLALLHLAAPSLNTPLTLADNALMDTLSVGDPLTTLGWGATAYDNNLPYNFPDLLQHVGLTLADFSSCNAAYDNTLTDNMLCATALMKDSCSGDSGGPLVYQDEGTWYQTGITSFDIGCASPGFPGVYARVAGYTRWISDTTSVALTPTQTFGSQGIGHMTQEVLELANNTGADISLASLTLSGSSSFSIINETCTGVIIADSDNCTITVKFQPDSAVQHGGSVVITLDTQETRSSTLTGVGLSRIDGAALDDTDGLEWFSGDDANWNPVCRAGNVNGTALSSGTINHNETSTLVTYITGPATLTFRWRASSEPRYDFGRFYVDGALRKSISGQKDWVQEQIVISDNDEHVLQWSYEKDFSINANDDRIWLDAINTAVTATNTGATCGGGSGGSGGGGSPNPLWLLLFPLLWSRVSRLSGERNRVG